MVRSTNGSFRRTRISLVLCLLSIGGPLLAGCDAKALPWGDGVQRVSGTDSVADGAGASDGSGESSESSGSGESNGGHEGHHEGEEYLGHEAMHAGVDGAGAEHDMDGMTGGMRAPAGAAAPDSAPAPTPAPTNPITIPDEPLHFERPQYVRGIYLNAWASGSTVRTSALMEMAARTEINTFVIDIKDASGYVSYATNVELAREIGATGEIRIRNISALLERLQAAGIYPIARIVVFQDPLLANARPDLAIQDSAGGVWQDGSGHSWVNPYHEDVWDYNIALAEEAARLGFPEIQWDYVRFPDASNEDLARSRYPRQDGRKRSIAIRDFLIHGNRGLQELGVDITADVFGVATSARTDVGIGQLWEDFIDVVNVALPMVYPSHYWTGSFGIQEPNDRPYEIVLAALKSGMERSRTIPDAGTIRPWLQDFTLGAPRYGAPEVRAQIEATYDAGIQEWIFWNASGRYTEAAFAPAAGFPEGADPLIRFGGEVVPASARFLPPPAPITATDSVPGGAAADTLPVPADTLRVPADTSGTLADTLVIPDTTARPDTTALPGTTAVIPAP